MFDLLSIYHELPYQLRCLVASVKGYYLRFWRYGTNTEKLIGETLERERWSSEKWKTWQEERLAYILQRAAIKVPYYRQHWTERRRRGDRASYKYLENWNILKKEVLRENVQAFVAEDCNRNEMYCDRTSGTTGTPLYIYLKKETVRKQYAIFEARVRRWHGVSIKERWAILGGQLVVPFKQTKPPFWVLNAGLNQLYLSTYHVSAQNAKAYLKALCKYHPTHMIVYPSSAHILATSILEQGLEPPATLKVIFSNAELLLDRYRESLQKAFRCPVINTYGMSEAVAFASECLEGKMHISPEVGIIEISDDQDSNVKTDEMGKITATGLLNADMPLIRYEVGDRGQLDLSQHPCQCGRNLPILAKVEGRTHDSIITKDGRSIFWLNPVFYGLPIIEAQIIQESLERILICFVPASIYTNKDNITIIKRLQKRVGKEVEIELKKVKYIPRSTNGKFRSVISHAKHF